MKKRKTRRNVAVIAIVLLLILTAAVVYGAIQKGEVTVKNNMSTGSVDIDLTAYEQTDHGEQKARKGEAVMANQEISYIPRITALRADCYVRLSVNLVMEKNLDDPITVDHIVSLGKNWIQKGSVFYYTKPLKNGEETDAFQGVHVPEEWTNQNSSNFQIHLAADSIQAENFTPDFDSDQPWGSVVMERAKIKDSISCRVAKRVKDAHSLTYKGSGVFEVSSGDFFSNFGYMMAGDSLKDSIQLHNDSREYVRLDFKSIAPRNNLLLEKTRLSLTVGGKAFYSGDLKAENLSAYKELTRIAPGETKKLRYELMVPESLKNAFSAEYDSVTWCFKATEVDPYGKPVQTGDNATGPVPFVLLGIAASGMVWAALAKKRKGEK